MRTKLPSAKHIQDLCVLRGQTRTKAILIEGASLTGWNRLFQSGVGRTRFVIVTIACHSYRPSELSQPIWKFFPS